MAGRVSLVGEEALVADPSRPIVRVSTVAAETLAEYPPEPVRATQAAVSILVSGEPPAPGRVSAVATETLAGAPASPVRATQAAASVLVAGLAPPPSRVSLVAGETLVAAAPAPVRMSQVAATFLSATDRRASPGRLAGTRAEVSCEATYPVVSDPQSDVWVAGLVSAGAVVSPIQWPEVSYRAAAVSVSVSVPSSILTRDPAGRLYANWSQATVESAYPAASEPRSTLWARSVAQHVGSTSGYPDKDTPASLGAAHSVSAAATVESTPWLPPSAPQSDAYASAVVEAVAVGAPNVTPGSDATVTAASSAAGSRVAYDTDGSDLLVSYQDQRAAVGSAAVTSGSDLWVSYHDQRAVVGAAEYVARGSDVWVGALRQSIGVPSTETHDGSAATVGAVMAAVAKAETYPDRYHTDARLHATSASTTRAATWLDDYTTQLRAHQASVSLTVAPPEGVYVDPGLVRSAEIASAVVSTAAVTGDPPDAEGVDLTTTATVETAAVRVAYGDPGVQSTVFVDSIDVEAVYPDTTFAPITENSIDRPVVVSVSMTFD